MVIVCLSQVNESHEATCVDDVSGGRRHGLSVFMSSLFPRLYVPVQTAVPPGGRSQSVRVHRSVTHTHSLIHTHQFYWFYIRQYTDLTYMVTLVQLLETPALAGQVAWGCTNTVAPTLLVQFCVSVTASCCSTSQSAQKTPLTLTPALEAKEVRLFYNLCSPNGRSANTLLYLIKN